MIDTALLEQKISESGKTYGHLAKACGITVQTMRLKRLGQYPFNTDEVMVLCNELGITKLTDKEQIFFAKVVDRNSTK